MSMANTLIEKSRPIEILLVEDNPGDVMLTIRAFNKGKLANNIQVAEDGEIAVEMLRKEGVYAEAVTPDIILLDLNLPKLNGQEVLEEIRKDSLLKRIPVVVLTSSKSDMDVVKSYDLCVGGYIIKPVDMKQFTHIVEAIENFWFSIVVLPDEEKIAAEISASDE